MSVRILVCFFFASNLFTLTPGGHLQPREPDEPGRVDQRRRQVDLQAEQQAQQHQQGRLIFKHETISVDFIFIHQKVRFYRLCIFRV